MPPVLLTLIALFTASAALAADPPPAQVPVPGKLERLYQDGDRRALIIYHPTYQDDFLFRITERFAQGLAESGSQVRRITADPKAVAALDLDSYDTIVFGTNVLDGVLDRPTQQVLDVLPPLQQRFCAALVSGKRDTEAVEAEMRARMNAKGCFEPLVWAFWTEQQHMDPFLNLADPRPDRAIALQVARSRGYRSGVWWTRYRLRD